MEQPTTSQPEGQGQSSLTRAQENKIIDMVTKIRLWNTGARRPKAEQLDDEWRQMYLTLGIMLHTLVDGIYKEQQAEEVSA